jgi:hypothetical protein
MISLTTEAQVDLLLEEVVECMSTLCQRSTHCHLINGRKAVHQCQRPHSSCPFPRHISINIYTNALAAVFAGFNFQRCTYRLLHGFPLRPCSPRLASSARVTILLPIQPSPPFQDFA